MRGRLRALEERPFRLLFAGQAVSLLGDGMVGVALAFAVLELTGSASDLGIVLAARTIPLVLFLLAGGVWADRLPRRARRLQEGRGRRDPHPGPGGRADRAPAPARARVDRDH